MIANDPDHDYSPFDDDLPRVQIPLGRDQLGLTIDGEFYPHYELPEEAREILIKYLEGGGRPGGIGATKVHECTECADRDDGFDVGYLTTSDNIGDYRNPYTCGHTWQEEQTTNGGTTAGRYAPRPWDIDLKVNGADSRTIREDGEERTYTLTIRRKAEYRYEADVLDETTVELPADGGTITGVTDGKRWEADVEIRGETAKVDWRRVDEDGNTVRYAYREEQERLGETESIGFLPLDDIDLDDAESEPAFPSTPASNAKQYDVDDGYPVVVRELSASTKSRVRERECGNTDFRRVYPNSTLVDEDDLIPIGDLSADDVPNTKSHLSRIQNQISNSVSRDEMLKTVAEAVAEFRATH